MLTTLEMARAEFGFYAAHIALYNGEVEPLHGHTFQVTLRVSGEPDTSGMVAEFRFRRAVDQNGNVLDILVTSRRDTKAATRFFRKLLKGLRYVPRVLVTDKLGSYRAAQRLVLRSVEHRQSKYLNNRA